MYRLKLLGVPIGTLLILGAIAASASAFTLPDISITLSGTYPIHTEGSLPTAVTALSTAGGSVLTGTGFSLLLLTTELSGLGTFSMTLLKIQRKAGEECNTVGDAAGVLLVSGEFHIVLGPGGTKKLLFLLLLLTAFESFCAAVDFEIRGSEMASFALPGEVETEEIEVARGKLIGSKGKPEFSEYFNDGGTIVKAKLELEAGAGFTASAENVAGEFILTTLGSKMYEVTGR